MRPGSGATSSKPSSSASRAVGPLRRDRLLGSTAHATTATSLLQILDFDDHADWERFWNGPEMVDFRAYCQGWYQIPVLYAWNDLVCSRRLAEPRQRRLSRTAQLRSSGAIVRPAALNCSQ